MEMFSLPCLFQDIFALLSSQLLACPPTAGIKWTRYSEYGSCVRSDEEKLLKNCDVHLEKLLSKQSLGKTRNGQWLEKRFRAYFRESKWLKAVSRFISESAADFLLFRLYVRKKGNWDLVA